MIRLTSVKLTGPEALETLTASAVDPKRIIAISATTPPTIVAAKAGRHAGKVNRIFMTWRTAAPAAINTSSSSQLSRLEYTPGKWLINIRAMTGNVK